MLEYPNLTTITLPSPPMVCRCLVITNACNVNNFTIVFTNLIKY